MTPERWQRIKDVFQEAMEHPPAERGVCVATATGEDSELRHEVEKMLRHATGIGLLDTPAWQGVKIENELQSGAHLGPYEILQEVGAGGMGRVYKARDTRLGRTVAIKVLKAEFSGRLWMEGRAISALNHPHVCALHDVGDQDGTAYLMMEYVEGESLAGKLANGPLPLDGVLRYGAEIADALAEAHSQGIVHRDLKPANIMITASGVKVLDFGIAQMAGDGETPSGGVAGTAAYMSPSQWNGNPADARTDVFALGLVLYEMATGTRYTEGCLKLPASVPAGLAALIEHCVRRDGAARLQRMEEVRSTLDQLRAERVTAPGGNWKRRAEVAAVLGLAAAVGILGWETLHAPAPTTLRPQSKPAISSSPAVPVIPAVHTNPKPPATLATLAAYRGMKRDPSFSPDGKSVAFAWQRRAGFGIYTRPLRANAPVLELTNGAEGTQDWGPAWSPDGSKIAFRRQAADEWGIYWIPALGGREQFIAPLAQPGQQTLPQISWSHDGNWIASPDRDSSGATRIYLFSITHGTKLQLTTNRTGTDHAPAFSPDGRKLAYTSCASGAYGCDVYVLDLDRSLMPRARHRITTQQTYVRGVSWLPDGRSLVYASGKNGSGDTYLWRVTVDPPRPPQRIGLAGPNVHHPAVSMSGGLLAYTKMGQWNLMMIENLY